MYRSVRLVWLNVRGGKLEMIVFASANRRVVPCLGMMKVLMVADLRLV
jgi:hypothetical protein